MENLKIPVAYFNVVYVLSVKFGIFLEDQFLIWVVKETTQDRVQRQVFESQFFVVGAFVTLAKVLNFSVLCFSFKNKNVTLTTGV